MSLCVLCVPKLRGWVCRHAKRHPKSSSVAHNDKTIQNLECDRRQDKEVDRRDAVDVIAGKRPRLEDWREVADAQAILAGTGNAGRAKSPRRSCASVVRSADLALMDW